MTKHIWIAAAALMALTACETRTKKTETNKPETQREDQRGQTAGEAADEAAEATRDAADATIRETEDAGARAAEATRDAADATLRETERAEETISKGETLPPEPGVDMPEHGEETPNPGTNEDGKDVTAEMPPEVIGTAVMARFEKKLDRAVIFTVSKAVDEIELQSGKELRVSFMDLKLLTGMEPEDAIAKLQDAGEIEVRVLGDGSAMRVVDINLPEDDNEKIDDRIKMEDEKGGSTGY